MKIGPHGYFTQERLSSRKREDLPPVLFHWTRLEHALKILADGAFKGNPGLSTTENPAFNEPGPVVFVLSPSAILARGFTLWPVLYGKNYIKEAEWFVASDDAGLILDWDPPVSSYIRLPLRGVVRMIGYKRWWPQEARQKNVRALRDAARRAGLRVQLFSWEDWWEDGLVIP